MRRIDTPLRAEGGSCVDAIMTLRQSCEHICIHYWRKGPRVINDTQCEKVAGVASSNLR